MISVSLPLPPTGLRTPGSGAVVGAAGDFALTLADMLTIAGAEVGAPAARQIAAADGKSLPVAPPDDIDAVAAETMLPPQQQQAQPPITAASPPNAPVARDHAPEHARAHLRRKEALAALPLPIPAALPPPLARPSEAADPAATAIPGDIPVAMPTAHGAATTQATAAPVAARARPTAAASAPTPRDPAAATSGAVAASATTPMRPTRFLRATADTDARPLLPRSPQPHPPFDLPGPVPKAPGARAAHIVDPAQPPMPDPASTGQGAAPAGTRVRQERAGKAPHVPKAPLPEAPGGGPIPEGGAAAPATSKANGASTRADAGEPRRSAPVHPAGPSPRPAPTEYLKTASPLLARVIAARRPAANPGPQAAPAPTGRNVADPVPTPPAPAAEPPHRALPAAPLSSARLAAAASDAAQPATTAPQPTQTDAARPTASREPAAPAQAARAPAVPSGQPAPTMPTQPAPAVRAHDAAPHPADGAAAPAPVRAVAPGPRPITIVPPAAAPIAAMFGGARPLGASPPRPLDRPEPPTGMVSAPTAAHAAAPLQTLAEAQRTPLDMRRDDWTQKLIDRIETIRDAVNAADTRIKLMPDALGKIDVAMRKDGDTVHVAFTADVPATRALLADAQPRLAELAQQRGLRLGQASVDAGTGGEGQQQRPADPRPLPARPTRAASRDEAFTETGRVA